MSDEQQQPSQPAQTPQWIPAAPPHPYAAPPKTSPTGGKALTISAMAVGLVALLTIGVSVAYFNTSTALFSGVLGLVAVVLGIIALVKKLRPSGAAITGVGAGALSVVAVTALFAAGALAPNQTAPNAGEGGEAWQPGTGREALLEWPANMSSGGIVFTGPGDPRPVPTEPLPAGTAPTPHQVDRGTSTDILIYVDYRCPHCMEFEQQNSDLLTELLASGNTTVEIVPLSFMDRISEGSQYSSRAAGAIACFADAQPELTWAAHNTLLSRQVQPGAGKGLNNEQLVAAFEPLGNVSAAVRDCITTQRFVPFAQALNEWTFQNPVPNTVATNVRIEGTPTVLVNGQVFPGDPSDPAQFREFVKEQGN